MPGGLFKKKGPAGRGRGGRGRGRGGRKSRGTDDDSDEPADVGLDFGFDL